MCPTVERAFGLSTFGLAGKASVPLCNVRQTMCKLAISASSVEEGIRKRIRNETRLGKLALSICKEVLILMFITLFATVIYPHLMLHSLSLEQVVTVYFYRTFRSIRETLEYRVPGQLLLFFVREER